eukprot:COSAG06_NODE_37189_length_438_cov_0.761062_1_plen_21_part_10
MRSKMTIGGIVITRNELYKPE